MFNLNELCVMAYENASKREAKDGKVSTVTMQMLKHTATEVVEATEAYSRVLSASSIREAVDRINTMRADFASELADIICCVLIIAGKENIDMEKALLRALQSGRKLSLTLKNQSSTAKLTLVS